MPEINEETQSILSNIQHTIDEGKGYDLDFSTDNFVGHMEQCEDSLKSFLIQWNETGDRTGNISEAYQEYMSHMENSTKAFANSLKTVAANMAIMLAINLTIKAIAYAWDQINVTVEEQTRKVEELTASYNALKSEYETLQNKQGLTDAEQERLKYLERRLELDERILKAEQSQLFDEKTSSKFTDWFDKDNLNVQLANEKERNIAKVSRGGIFNVNTYGFEYISNKYEKDIKKIDKYEKRIAEFKEAQKDFDFGSDQWNIYQEGIEESVEKQGKLIDGLTKYEDQLTINQGKYLDNTNYLSEQIDSGDLSESQMITAKQQLEEWTSLYEQTENIIEEIQKKTGGFDYDTTSVINGALGKLKFDGVKEQLEDLAKAGSLSIGSITEKFPALIEYLKQSGVSAKDLVEYIKMLNNPDYLNIDYAKEKLKKNYQKKFHGYDAVYAGNGWDRYITGKPDEEIKILYSIIEDTSTKGWSFKDFDAELEKRQHSEIDVKVQYLRFCLPIFTVKKYSE